MAPITRHKRYVRYSRYQTRFIGISLSPIIRSGTSHSRSVRYFGPLKIGPRNAGNARNASVG
jgi:hypothetical protein